MKMRPGAQTGFLLCGKEWSDGEAFEVRSPWDQGLIGKVTVATRADAREAVNHAVASLRRTRALPPDLRPLASHPSDPGRCDCANGPAFFSSVEPLAEVMV